ncbi:hypothetical protein R83H12_01715 [Fibrobacteria bacterium R8-3-H12]
MQSKLSMAFTLTIFTAVFAAPSCPGGAKPFEGTGRGASEGKAREEANINIVKSLSNIKVTILDELTQRETSNDIKEYANYQRKINIEGGLYAGFVKDAEYPYQKENGLFVAKRYLCPSDVAKPYLDSLKGINQHVSIQKVNNSFCATLYKTYSPRVMLFERILEHFGEMDESKIASYKKAERECDNMSASIAKGYVGFEEALEKAVAEIVSKRGKAQTKIVIAEIYASPDELSDFITDELKSRLTKVRTFSLMQADMNAKSDGKTFKMGPMKYDDAIKVGKKADVVLVGRFAPYEKFSHFKIEALEIKPPSKTIAMHTDKIRPDEAELADLISGKPPAITDEALAYLNKGIDLYRKEKDDEAIEDFNAALRIKPDYRDALCGRGLAYYFKGNYDRAIEDFEAVLRINPNDADAKKNLEVVRQEKAKARK